MSVLSSSVTLSAVLCVSLPDSCHDKAQTKGCISRSALFRRLGSREMTAWAAEKLTKHSGDESIPGLQTQGSRMSYGTGLHGS